MKEKVVLYLGGGSMLGVFEAGIVTALQEQEAYEKIERIYAGSAGAFNAAYFLARQSELGSSIYWDDLQEGFIYPIRVFSGSIQRIWNSYTSLRRVNTHNVLDMDFVMNVVRDKKRLNVEEIMKQNVEFYVKVLDVKTGKIEYVDGKQDTMNVLKSSSSVIPYYASDRQQHVDGDIVEPIGLEEIISMHPHSRIVVAINHFPERGILHDVKSFFEGVVASRMYPRVEREIFDLFCSKNRKFMRDISLARKNERVLLIYPPRNRPSSAITRDVERLKQTWEMGKKEAGRILEFMK